MIAATLVAFALLGTAPALARTTAAAPAQSPDGLDALGDLVGGVWEATYMSGRSRYDVWSWGPGRDSLAMRAEGFDANGEPRSRVHLVVHRHPGLGQLRFLELSTNNRVGVGRITLDEGQAVVDYDFYDYWGAFGPRRTRTMRLHWSLEGADTFREEMLESNGRGSMVRLAEWRGVRRPALPDELERADAAPRPTQRLDALARLVGPTWSAGGDWAPFTETTYEWIPDVDAVHGRAISTLAEKSGRVVEDHYFYVHPETEEVHYLGLAQGSVTEGILQVLDDGSLELDLTRSDGVATRRYVQRLDFTDEGELHEFVWAVEGDERRRVSDVRRTPVERGSAHSAR